MHPASHGRGYGAIKWHASRAAETIMSLLSGTIAFLATLTVAWAVHTPETAWMGPCCGERDCVQVIIAVLDHTAGVVFVRDRQISIHPAKIRRSEDGRTYWCIYEGVLPWSDVPSDDKTRCVFYSEGV